MNKFHFIWIIYNSVGYSSDKRQTYKEFSIFRRESHTCNLSPKDQYSCNVKSCRKCPLSKYCPEKGFLVVVWFWWNRTKCKIHAFADRSIYLGFEIQQKFKWVIFLNLVPFQFPSSDRTSILFHWMHLFISQKINSKYSTIYKSIHVILSRSTTNERKKTENFFSERVFSHLLFILLMVSMGIHSIIVVGHFNSKS